MVDFSLLSGNFGLCDDPQVVDSHTDFNADGCTELLDFSLLAANFGRAGATVGVSAQSMASGPVVMTMQPTRPNVAVGGMFDVVVDVHAGDVSVDGAAVFLDFDPAVLQVRAVSPGDVLSTVIRQAVDTASGHVDFAAGRLGSQASGSFRLVTITFEVIGDAPQATIAASLTTLRRTDVTGSGQSVLGQPPQPVTIAIGNAAASAYRLFLPVIMR
ncbi:MAG: hypothetical protein Kow0047_27640 [Anaerolineae bacterium]